MKDLTQYINESKTNAIHPVVEAKGEYKIYFPTLGAFAIQVGELRGQVSDGYWENARRYNHWKWVVNTEPEIVDGKEGYTGPIHRIKYSTEWLRRYVKKALKDNGGDYGWTIRVFKYAKLGHVTPENILKEIVNNYDAEAWCSIAEKLREEEIDNAGLKKKCLSGYDYLKKYWEAAGDKYFTDEILKKYYKSSYNWGDFEDDLDAAEDAMNTQIKE